MSWSDTPRRPTVDEQRFEAAPTPPPTAPTPKRKAKERTEPPFATQPVARGRKLIATLGTFDRNATNRLHVALMEFRRVRYVDARLEYRLRDDEPWVPTSKGVTFKRAEAEALAVALLRAIDEWPTT